MSGIVWTKFFWSDWLTDIALRNCSYGARGLWMDMLCIAAAHDPIGYVAVAGRALNETSIARMTGGQESEVRALLGELDRNGVFSRDRQGRIYSRRMVSDARRAALARKNGKKGGNPKLGNGEGNSTRDKDDDNSPLKPQEPEAKSQIRVEEPKGSLSACADVGPSKDDIRWAFDLWNATASRVGLSTARDLTGQRRAKIKARLKDGGRERWSEAISAVESSPFCRGDNRDGWRANLDFVLQAGSFAKLIEGAYAPKDAAPAASVVPLRKFSTPSADVYEQQKALMDAFDPLSKEA